LKNFLKTANLTRILKEILEKIDTKL